MLTLIAGAAGVVLAFWGVAGSKPENAVAMTVSMQSSLEEAEMHRLAKFVSAVARAIEHGAGCDECRRQERPGR